MCGPPVGGDVGQPIAGRVTDLLDRAVLADQSRLDVPARDLSADGASPLPDRLGEKWRECRRGRCRRHHHLAQAPSATRIVVVDGVGPRRRRHDLLVQAVQQELVEGDHADDADDDAHHREEREHPYDEPGPKAPPAHREDGGTTAHSAGLRTYPAPRIVWIIGARPASTFLRR